MLRPYVSHGTTKMDDDDEVSWSDLSFCKEISCYPPRTKTVHKIVLNGVTVNEYLYRVKDFAK